MSGRKPLVAGNWKMNKCTGEAVVLAQDIVFRVANKETGVETVLCPPSIDLKSVSNVLAFEHSEIGLGAQNVFWEPSGAFTGEIGAPMLKEVGCSWCIVGHSERREIFGETDDMVRRKVLALFEQGLKPIVCVGEDLAVRDAGTALAFVTSQVRAALSELPSDKVATSVVAYEPVWAIGTGRTATPEQAQEMCAAIRQTLGELYGEDVAQKVRILYGGSMKPENVEFFVPCPDIDGGLIGGASLKAEQFEELVKAFDRRPAPQETKSEKGKRFHR